MPELPEVETVMRGLAARLTGRRILSVRAARPDLRWPLPSHLDERLRGRCIEGFRRRGKYILMRLEGGDSLIVHLGMSGRLLLVQGSPDAARHEHLVLRAEGGWRLAFIDPRRFGSIDLVPTAGEEQHPRLAYLGPEPLAPDFAPATLAARLARHRTTIKAALLDQKVVAGIGNIYASEALFRARISPRRVAAGLGPARVARLFAAIRETLADAIAAGGSSFSDYVQPDGTLGYFQHAWQVYGRERCPACPRTPHCRGIVSVVQAGRTSFYCPRLQR